MKKKYSIIVSIVIICCILVTYIPANAKSDNANMTVGSAKQKSDYKGDYIVAYNPSYSASNSKSTGTFSYKNNNSNQDAADDMWWYDVHMPLIGEPKTDLAFTKAVYSVGDSKKFDINANVFSSSISSVSFDCMAVGDHCYIWFPTNNSDNKVFRKNKILTQNEINQIKTEFEDKYPIMTSTFGTYTESLGKLNILLYDLQDGYSGSGGYVGGYFSANDIYYYNRLPMIHVDTYPQMAYGDYVENCYSVLFHEMQHLINFTRTRGETPLWLNEAMSAAAEEVTYPGSSVQLRINSWNKNESAYMNYHNGKSIYSFDNSLGSYAMVSIFSQYLRIQANSTNIFDSIISNLSKGYDTETAIEKSLIGTDLEGMTLSELMLAFRVATVAQQDTGIYGFHGEITYYKLKKMCISSIQDVEGGGAVIINSNGSYSVPNNADNGLVYVGITVDNVFADPTSIDGPESLSINLNDTVNLAEQLIIEPSGNYIQDHIDWTTSNSTVASISQNGILTGHSSGVSTITAQSVVSDVVYTFNVFVSTTESFIVTFYDWDDTVLSQQKVEYGNDAQAPQNPTREHYKFIGWDTDFTNVTQNIDVHALYEINTYTVTFFDTVSNTAISEFTVNSGYVLADKDFPQVPEHTDYIFNGWDYNGDSIVNNIVINAVYKYVEPQTVLIGDSNLDGKINTADAVFILKYCAGAESLSEEQTISADVTFDGIVNTGDAVYILKYCAGIITKF